MRNLEGYAETPRNVQRKVLRECSRKVSRKVLFAVPFGFRGMQTIVENDARNHQPSCIGFWNLPTTFQKCSTWVLGRFRRALGTTYGKSLETDLEIVMDLTHPTLTPQGCPSPRRAAKNKCRGNLWSNMLARFGPPNDLKSMQYIAAGKVETMVPK